MASLIDLSGLTLNEEEVRAASEAIFEKVFVKPELTSVHSIRTGIRMKTQIPFYGKFGLVGKADPGSCAVNDETQTISTSQKYWDPALISYRLTHCQDNISELYKMWEKALKTNPDEWEQIDNGMVAFLEDRTVDASQEAILRLTSFGDTAADNVSGGGLITNGVDKTYFTPMDGLWKQIYTGVAATTILRYEITENSAASYAAQDSLASDRALKTFRYLYNNADARMMAEGNIVFEVTRSIFNNWHDYLEDKSLVFTLDRAESGSNISQYRGIPIIVRHDWDRNIRAYQDNGTTYNDPHRVILTDLNNIPVGTPETDSFSKLDMWYERKDKKHYIDAAFRLDVKVLEEYMIAVAY